MVDRRKTIRLVSKEIEREILKNAKGKTMDVAANYGGVAPGKAVSPGPGEVWWSVSATLLILVFSLPLQTTGANHMAMCGEVRGACPADCLHLFLSLCHSLSVPSQALIVAKKERVKEKERMGKSHQMKIDAAT